MKRYTMISFGLQPRLPPGMQVDGCHAVILKCESEQDFMLGLKDVVFSCQWDDLREPGFASSGEALDAWEWRKDGVLVTIGTEDPERLAARLKLAPQSTPTITMHNNEVRVCVEAVPEGCALSLHYVVAWNALPEAVDCSCWYAVDIDHDKILGRLKNPVSQRKSTKASE